MSIWSNVSPEVISTIITSTVTIVAATIGALLVIWQIGVQAHNAIRQTRHNEALKLKLKIYNEITDLCNSYNNTELELSYFTNDFELNTSLFKEFNGNWPIPKARSFLLSQKKSAFDKAEIEIGGLTERWQIIDPRISIFRIALASASYEIGIVYEEYCRFACPLMPIEAIEGPDQGRLLPWTPPSDTDMKKLIELGGRLRDKLMTHLCYVLDFRDEMQNLLLGELFDNKIPPREPIDPSYRVISLDQYESLKKYFEEQTEWGHNKTTSEDRARAKVTDRS